MIFLLSLLVITFSASSVSCEALAKSVGSEAGSNSGPGSGRWARASDLVPHRHSESDMHSQEDSDARHGNRRGRRPLALDVGASPSALGTPFSDSERDTEQSAERASGEALDLTRPARVLHVQRDRRTSNNRRKAGAKAEAEPRANRAGEDTGRGRAAEAAVAAKLEEHSQLWLRGGGGSGMDRNSFWRTRAARERSGRRPDHEAGNVPCEVINKMAGWVIRNCGYSRLVRRACESGTGSAASSGAASPNPVFSFGTTTTTRIFIVRVYE